MEGKVKPGKITADWLVGFVDADGCFTISKVRDRKYQPRFMINQSMRNTKLIHRIQFFLGCGHIYKHRTYATRNEYPQETYIVQSEPEITEVIIPFFDEHPLRGTKFVSYQVWRYICNIVFSADGLVTKEEAAEIDELRVQMNPRGLKPRGLK